MTSLTNELKSKLHNSRYKGYPNASEYSYHLLKYSIWCVKYAIKKKDAVGGHIPVYRHTLTNKHYKMLAKWLDRLGVYHWVDCGSKTIYWKTWS